MSQDNDLRMGLEEVIRNAGERAASARRVRSLGITGTIIGMMGSVVFAAMGISGEEALICLMIVFAGTGGALSGGRAVRRAVMDLHAALDHLDVSKWLDDSGVIDLEAMLAGLQAKKGVEIREGGAAYFLQRGHGSIRLAEGLGGVDEWKKDRKRVDAMGPRPEIESVEIEARPSEELMEEANKKRAEDANVAFIHAEKKDRDLIEAGVERLGDSLGGPVTSSERP